MSKDDSKKPSYSDLEQQIKDLTWERDWYKRQVDLDNDRDKWRDEGKDAAKEQGEIIKPNNDSNDEMLTKEKERIAKTANPPCNP